MIEKFFIPIILGTARIGRQSEKVAKAIYNILKAKNDIEVELIDVKDYIHGHTIPPWAKDESTSSWRKIVARAKGFIIVTPEYNHGYPGELKMLLDQEYEAYKGKTVAVCTVSRGGFGGIRALENLLPVFHELGLKILHDSISISKVDEFPEDINQIDPKFVKQVEDISVNL